MYNKTKTEDGIISENNNIANTPTTDTNEPVKRKRGRPKGSKNKTAKNKNKTGTATVKPATNSNSSIKPKGYRRPGSIIENTTATPDEVGLAIKHSAQYFGRKCVKTDEECEERIAGYFRDCFEQQMIPTVEGLSLALGTHRQVIWRWENGEQCSQNRAAMIKQAKQILAGIDAELVSSGKIPQVVYIFRSKNFYGMTDQQEITVSANTQSEQDMSAEDIAKRYLDDGKRVETTFSDAEQDKD